MRKIIFVMTVLMVMASLNAEEVKAFDQCSGTYKTYTSEMNKKTTKVKESKLTSLSYVKKICKITATYNSEDCNIYKLDDGNGVLYINGDNTFKICVLVKDGHLYGRTFSKSDKGRTLTYNLHDKECSIKGKGFKATEEDIILLTIMSFKHLTEFADKFILNETTN